MKTTSITPTSADTPRARLARVLSFYADRAPTDGVTVRLGDLRELMDNVTHAAAARRAATRETDAPARLRVMA
jgi:hypothetical protein